MGLYQYCDLYNAGTAVLCRGRFQVGGLVGWRFRWVSWLGGGSGGWVG